MTGASCSTATMCATSPRGCPQRSRRSSSRRRSSSPTASRENIRFAAARTRATRTIARAAALAGAAEFIAALPDGYETVLGERGFSLSGGQRQRIAIARAILADPRVLVLDDATSAVDATKEHEIRAALAEVMRGRTTLVIAHRPATIALADRVAVLEDGRIVEEGTHGELLRAGRRATGEPAARPRDEQRRVMNERASPREIWRRRASCSARCAPLSGAAAAVIVSTLITLAGPLLVRYAVDAGITKNDHVRSTSRLRSSSSSRREALRRAGPDAVRGDGRRALPRLAALAPSTSSRPCRSASSSASAPVCSSHG